jgi:O-succinylbenzoate synthase
MDDELSIDVPGDLTRIELHRVRLPLLVPFVASHGTETDRDVVLVHLVAGGRDGWAECSTLSEATYVDESTDRAWLQLRDELGPALLAGRGSATSFELGGRRAAVAALEIGLLDLTGAWSTGGGRTSVTPTCVLGRQASIDELLALVDAAVRQGYRSVKSKVGPGWDLEPLRAIRSAWPASTLTLAADANGSYTIDDLEVLARLDDLDLAYLEQPTAARDVAAVRARIATKVALDESILSVDDVRQAVRAEAVDVLNVKSARLGGLARAVDAATIARDAGVSCFVGGMLETGVGRSVALRLAARDEFDLPTDLGPSARYFAEDLTEPIGWAAPGVLVVPDDPTLVRRPRPARLTACTTDVVVLQP